MISLYLVGLLTIDHVGVTCPGQQSFFRMLDPWLQPPIHVVTRSTTGLASPNRVRCASLRLMPNWGSLSNTFLVGHESGILMTCPSHRILRAFSTVRMLGSLVVHPSPPLYMLLHAANDGPEGSNMPRAFASSVFMVQNSCPSSVSSRSLLDLSSR